MNQHFKFTVPDLPYDYDALGKYISADIMRLHHDKHHQAYVDKLNAAVKDVPRLQDMSLDEILLTIEEIPENHQGAIRDNGGGHYNHSLFWLMMSPHGGGEPAGELGAKITEVHGSFQGFVDKFTTEAMGIFGSGWAWLMPDMEIVTTANQDSPRMTGGDTPILGLDVWEHAYYLDYKNKRDDYIAAWWNVVNWEYVTERYNKLHS